MKLYTKILFWFFLNLVVLGAAFYSVFRLQFHFGFDSLLMGQAGERMQALGDVLQAELKATPTPGWNDVLKRFSDAYKVKLYLFGSDGSQIAGETVALPATVLAKITERRGPMGMGRGPSAGRGRNRDFEASTAAHSRFVEHTSGPNRYWIGICLPLETERDWVRPPRLLAMSTSLHGGGLFLDLRPWVLAGFAALLFSVLFWLPLIRGITRSISQMTQATQQVAEGRFDVSVPSKRTDELGHLAQAINRMTARLSGFVTGQKRFLGDIAHELCSPIARLEVALGIIESRADEKQKPYVSDAREDVQYISSLVNELLSFSKAGWQQKGLKLEPVNLAALVRQVVDREAPNPSCFKLQLDESVQALAEPGLLARAAANLLRNALRYAGTAGPITLSVTRRADQAILSVADSGPGVPEEHLQQIFDPFFRLENSRSRETGGTGLGLAIVKTCVEACAGTVTARNRRPSGLQVDISLKAAP